MAECVATAVAIAGAGRCLHPHTTINTDALIAPQTLRPWPSIMVYRLGGTEGSEGKAKPADRLWRRCFHYLPLSAALQTQTGADGQQEVIGSSPHTDWGWLTVILQVSVHVLMYC